MKEIVTSGGTLEASYRRAVERGAPVGCERNNLLSLKLALQITVLQWR